MKEQIDDREAFTKALDVKLTATQLKLLETLSREIVELLNEI